MQLKTLSGGITSGALVSFEAVSQILLEEALQGREVSVLLFSDGRITR